MFFGSGRGPPAVPLLIPVPAAPPPALGTAGARPTGGRAVRRHGDPSTGRGSTTHHGPWMSKNRSKAQEAVWRPVGEAREPSACRVDRDSDARSVGKPTA